MKTNEDSRLIDEPLSREELKMVIDGRGCARRVPMIIHHWLYPETFKEPTANARVKELMAQYPCDAAFIRWRFIKLWEAPDDDPDYRWMHGTKPVVEPGAAIDSAGPLSDWAMLDDVLEHFPKASYPGLLAISRLETDAIASGTGGIIILNGTGSCVACPMPSWTTTRIRTGRLPVLRLFLMKR